MKVKSLFALLISIFLLCVDHLYAQQGNIFTNFKKTIVRADQLFEANSYVSAIDLYKEVLEKEPENGYARIKIARAYKKLNNHNEAEAWFRIAIENNSYAEPIDQLYFAQVLMINGKHTEAKDWLVRYTKIKKDIRAINNLVGIEHRESFYKDSALYKIEAVGINTTGNDFSPVFYDSTLIFLSNREKISPVRYINTWADNGFYDVYQSPVIEGKTLSEATVFNKIINSKYHEGPLAFYNGGRSMIFTRSIDKVNTKEERKLGLFTAEKIEGNKGWTNIQPFRYNSSEYSVFHPAISEDGDTLYFSSEMPGGYGGGDIYRSIMEDGQWSNPENMGSQVNTEGNELFPYLHGQTLYFSSDGHAGLGGLDIYKIDLYRNKEWQVVNLGYPLNSNYDDFSLAWRENKTDGALSSNRPNGHGSDDIYFFKNQLKPENNFLAVNGKVLDKSSKASVGDARIYVIDEMTGEDYTLKSDAEGKFNFQGKKGHSYTILADNAQKSGLISGKTVLNASEVIVIEIWGFPPYVAIEPEIRDISTGESIKLATVRLKEDGKVVSQEQTSFSGKAVLIGNAGSSYFLEINAIGYVSQEREIKILRSNSSDTLRLVLKLEKVKPKVALIKGKVHDALQNNGLEGATVHVLNHKNGEQQKYTTEKSGEFSFEGIVGETYKVIAEIEHVRTIVARYKVEDPSEAANEDILLKLNLNKPKEHMNFQTIEILMHDLLSEEAIPFGVVKLFSEDTIRQIDYTNLEGKLILYLEKHKSFVLKSDVLGYKESRQYINTSGDLISDTVQLSFSLEPLEIQTIQGFALSSGEKISNAKVFVLNESTGRNEEFLTDKDGHFSFRGKEGEIVSVLAEKDQTRGVLKSFELTARHFTAPLQIQLNNISAFVYLDVNVKDKKSGEGIPLASLALRQNKVPQFLVKSDMGGKAMLKVKKNLDYVLEITNTGYHPINYPISLTNEDSDTLTINIPLERQLPGRITMKGSMYVEGSKMVKEGATIFIVNDQTGESNIKTTDDVGDFYFDAKVGEVYDIVGEDQQMSGMVPDLVIKGPDTAANDEIRLPVNNLISMTAVAPLMRNDELAQKSIRQIIDENQIKFNEIAGFVYDKKTGSGVNEAAVYIINNSTGETHSLFADNKGYFKFKARLGHEVTVLADKDIKSGLLPYAKIQKIDEVIKVGIWGFPAQVVLKVNLIDQETKQPVRLALVGLQEGESYLQQEQTQISGTVYMRASVEGKYTIHAAEKQYESQSVFLEVPAKNKEGDTIVVNLPLAKRQPKLVSVTGTVLFGSTGKAVDSVAVFIMNSKTWEVETVQTDKAGKFSFKGLIGDHFQIIGEKNHIGTNLLDYSIVENAEPLILKLEDPNSREGIIQSLVYLKVKLRDSKSGNPISQGVVKLSLQDTVKQTVYVNDKGEKILLVQGNREYYLQGSKLDYLTSGQKVITQTQNPRDTVMVLINMDFVEKKEVTLAGIAVNGQTMGVLSGVKIYVRNETTGVDQVLETDATGKFIFAGVTGNTYTILAEGGGKRGNLNKFTVKATDIASAFQVRLYPINIPLVVTVHLNDQQTNEPIALAALTLRHQEAYQQTVNSNAEGMVLFHAHAGKDYSLEVRHPAYKSQFLKARSVEAKNDTIHLRAFLEKDLPLSIVMHGHVYDVESKRPLSAANIYIINNRNEETLEFKADQRGDFSFEATEGYTYTILADNELRSGMVTELLITDPEEKANPFIKIPAFGVLQPVAVHVQVVDEASGEGVSEALVKEYANNAHIRESLTDSDGKLVWEEYKNEGYHLVIEHDNYAKKLFSLEFGNARTGDTLKVIIPVRSLQKEPRLAQHDKEIDLDLFRNISIINNQSGEGQVFLSMDSGLFNFYPLNGNAVLGNNKEIIQLSKGWSEEDNLYFNLLKTLAQEGLQARDTVTIQNVYYDFDKYGLSKKAISELDYIAALMMKYSDINVELKAYTDSRGSRAYNKELAGKRVSAASQYLQTKGISEQRIIKIPVGEAGFVKDCSTQPCTETDHRLNRRTELLIKYQVEMLGSK